MIRVRGVKVRYDQNDHEHIIKALAKKICVDSFLIEDYKICKRSFDARRKDRLLFVYELDVCLSDESMIKFGPDVFPSFSPVYEVKKIGCVLDRPVIVGSGPSGLFAALILAESGFKPIIIERGERMEERIKTVADFWETGKLNCESNVQFGEGGAGTFSDGKLNTLVKDKGFRMKKVFDTFVLNGAPSDILYVNKPHIGTDLLSDVVMNMRNQIIDLGGEFRYNTKLTDLIVLDDCIKGIVVNDHDVIDCNLLVLAIGHSARDTFEMLYEKGVLMEAKPFAVGVRVQHPQIMINKNQYGISDLTADYKLTANVDGRGVYSFCMCPGGYVVNASSCDDMLVVNGMSYHDRGGVNANSAIVVSVSPKDFGDHPLDGVNFQSRLEKKAYECGNGKIPVQLFGDYKNRVVSSDFGMVKPCFKGDFCFCDINDILPSYVNDSLKAAMNVFDKKIKGFASDDVILAAVESRTSSPVRIVRDSSFNCNIKGVYPCGEGAGYAGGITTSAMDGIKVAEAIIDLYLNEN